METMDEIRVFGRCEYCGEEVTDELEEYYVNDYGEVFCSVECICQHYGVTKLEV
jgi:hypothetical protein